ncbi:MAG: hypothetical protein AB1611_10640 [bacterium]
MFKHSTIDLQKLEKGGLKMVDSIDVHDLPEEEVKFIQEFTEFIRQKVRSNKVQKGEEGIEEEITEEKALTAHSSNVIGKLTRREIYDYL